MQLYNDDHFAMGEYPKKQKGGPKKMEKGFELGLRTYELRAKIRVQKLTEMYGLKMGPVDALFPCAAFVAFIIHFCRFLQERG